jgi:tetratricopeptide (TPR) repeat protein
MVRFGMFEEVLSKEPPPSDLGYPQGVWHYTRGISNVRLGNVEEARRDLEALTKYAADPNLEAVTVWGLNTTRSLLQIADRVLTAELAAVDGEIDDATTALNEAIVLEDALTYDEPPPWYHPVRNIAGQITLDAGRFSDAEAFFREDLDHFPENGWSLFGLKLSLEAQGKSEAAAVVADRFESAWMRADYELN